jgi:hypothetical protein
MAKNKTLYRIRDKKTKNFILLGYSNKSTWLTYPSSVIKHNRHVIRNLDDYEIVVYEYVEKEVLPISL